MSEKHIKEDEIDLIELLQTIWKGRKTIIKSIVVFFLIGLFIAVFSPKEYTAKTVIVPQTGKKSGGNLSGLAAMAGVSIGGGNGSNDISPLLYPKVTESIPFLRELLDVPLTLKGIEGEVTYKEYYEKHQKFNLLSAIKKYTIGLPGVILSVFREKENVEAGVLEKKKESNIYRVSKKEKQLYNKINTQLNVNANEKEGIVTLSFSMPEAESSAKMAYKAQQLLQDFVTKFKINKAKEELIFIQGRYEEAKREFNKRQYILASFRDENRGLSTSRSQARLEKLQSNYSLAFEVYSELAKKLETQRIEVKKSTPIFTIIEPVSVPVERSKPRRAMILIIWLFIGITIGVGRVFVKDWLIKIKRKRK